MGLIGTRNQAETAICLSETTVLVKHGRSKLSKLRNTICESIVGLIVIKRKRASMEVRSSSNAQPLLPL